MKSSVYFLVFRASFREFLFQLLFDVRFAQIDGGLLSSVEDFWVSAAFIEQKSNFRLFILQRQMQRRVSFSVLDVDVSSVVHQDLGDCCAAECSSSMESRVLSVIDCVDVCAYGDQKFEDRFEALRSCVLKGGVTTLLFVVDISSFRNKEFHKAKVTSKNA